MYFLCLWSGVLFLLSLLFSLADELILSSYLQPLRFSLSSFLFCWSNSYSGCLSLWELFLFFSVSQGATEVSFSLLSCSVLLGGSHCLCFSVPSLVLSAGTSPAGCLDNLIQVGEDPSWVAGHSPLALSIVASCISDYHWSCRIGIFGFRMVFVACRGPVDGSWYWSSLPSGNCPVYWLEKLRQSG